ncbi:MAG: hypothetical protein FWF24_03645 [Alphaproteobacteria bacterium]|nr:hypothetical protein [Alphaproteobacteria bacterium]
MINPHTEKIVHLAREILNYERKPKASESPFMAGAKHRPTTRYEQTELDALVFYAARHFKQPEPELRCAIQNELDLKTLRDVSAYDYLRIRAHILGLLLKS